MSCVRVLKNLKQASTEHVVAFAVNHLHPETKTKSKMAAKIKKHCFGDVNTQISANSSSMFNLKPRAAVVVVVVVVVVETCKYADLFNTGFSQLDDGGVDKQNKCCEHKHVRVEPHFSLSSFQRRRSHSVCSLTVKLVVSD
ncbi:hypothetical protein JOB18_033668 [Solea senegalensis]|uniref:Uncharacterized protein n=1 Tax=Solea senegalensis TaxID=28829 RepID=A0AAV6PG99_SOLSE|nr:hypothetical protein JOB18_033668 [Solea senegalensis]